MKTKALRSLICILLVAIMLPSVLCLTAYGENYYYAEAETDSPAEDIAPDLSVVLNPEVSGVTYGSDLWGAWISFNGCVWDYANNCRVDGQWEFIDREQIIYSYYEIYLKFTPYDEYYRGYEIETYVYYDPIVENDNRIFDCYASTGPEFYSAGYGTPLCDFNYSTGEIRDSQTDEIVEGVWYFESENYIPSHGEYIEMYFEPYDYRYPHISARVGVPVDPIAPEITISTSLSPFIMSENGFGDLGFNTIVDYDGENIKFVEAGSADGSDFQYVVHLQDANVYTSYVPLYIDVNVKNPVNPELTVDGSYDIFSAYEDEDSRYLVTDSCINVYPEDFDRQMYIIVEYYGDGENYCSATEYHYVHEDFYGAMNNYNADYNVTESNDWATIVSIIISIILGIIIFVVAVIPGLFLLIAVVIGIILLIVTVLLIVGGIILSPVIIPTVLVVAVIAAAIIIAVVVSKKNKAKKKAEDKAE